MSGFRLSSAVSGLPSPLAGTLVGLLALLSPVAGARAAAPTPDPNGNGDVMRGWRVFHDKQCIACHAIWGEGGTIGPDLGRARHGRLSDGQLAGVMWNHIPKMLSRIKEAGAPSTVLTDTEMADIFALVYFVRQLGGLGDPARGEKTLRDKGCTECHSIDTYNGDIGPDLAKWGSYANPIIWAQMMWEHAPMMEEAMQDSGIRWPKLEGDDLVHIVAYVRSAGASGEKTYLRPGSAGRGRALFLDKECNACHPGVGPDLAEAPLPGSVAALASRMWNHSPAMSRVMRERAVARVPLDSQELADILTYLLVLGRRDRDGDASRGARIFVRNGCAECHESGGVLPGGAPSVGQLRGAASPIRMATAMWNHGGTMLAQMTEAGVSWPVFDGTEMVDLLAYLQEPRRAERSAGE